MNNLSPASETNPLPWTDRFVHRHIGPNAEETAAMLAACGFKSLEQMMGAAVPAGIRLKKPLALPASRSEYGLLNELRPESLSNAIRIPDVAVVGIEPFPSM